jgi:hypothetical protein
VSDRIAVPIRIYNGEKWGALTYIACGRPLEVVAEQFEQKKENFSLFGQHRVRLFKLKANIHFKLPADAVTLDISGVPAAVQPPPTRRQKGR